MEKFTIVLMKSEVESWLHARDAQYQHLIKVDSLAKAPGLPALWHQMRPATSGFLVFLNRLPPLTINFSISERDANVFDDEPSWHDGDSPERKIEIYAANLPHDRDTRQTVLKMISVVRAREHGGDLTDTA